MIMNNVLLVAEVDGNTYWRNPFNSLCNPRQLEEFIVMDIDIIRNQKLGAGAGLRSNRVSVYVRLSVLLESKLHYVGTLLFSWKQNQ